MLDDCCLMLLFERCTNIEMSLSPTEADESPSTELLLLDSAFFMVEPCLRCYISKYDNQDGSPWLVVLQSVVRMASFWRQKVTFEKRPKQRKKGQFSFSQLQLTSHFHIIPHSIIAKEDEKVPPLLDCVSCSLLIYLQIQNKIDGVHRPFIQNLQSELHHAHYFQ